MKISFEIQEDKIIGTFDMGENVLVRELVPSDLGPHHAHVIRLEEEHGVSVSVSDKGKVVFSKKPVGIVDAVKEVIKKTKKKKDEEE